jgi:tripartite-type tricarboxylate transporter receptor subunit TctC
LAGYEVLSFLGLAAPAGTPVPVVSKLNAEVRHILDIPDIRDRFKTLGGQQHPTSPDEMQAFVASEIHKWQDVVSARGIERQ